MKGKRRRQIQKEMEFKIEELEKEVEDLKTVLGINWVLYFIWIIIISIILAND